MTKNMRYLQRVTFTGSLLENTFSPHAYIELFSSLAVVFGVNNRLDRQINDERIKIIRKATRGSTNNAYPHPISNSLRHVQCLSLKCCLLRLCQPFVFVSQNVALVSIEIDAKLARQRRPSLGRIEKALVLYAFLNTSAFETGRKNLGFKDSV